MKIAKLRELINKDVNCFNCVHSASIYGTKEIRSCQKILNANDVFIAETEEDAEMLVSNNFFCPYFEVK